jgi:hypothetical protein
LLREAGSGISLSKLRDFMKNLDRKRIQEYSFKTSCLVCLFVYPFKFGSLFKHCLQIYKIGPKYRPKGKGVL